MCVCIVGSIEDLGTSIGRLPTGIPSSDTACVVTALEDLGIGIGCLPSGIPSLDTACVVATLEDLGIGIGRPCHIPSSAATGVCAAIIFPDYMSKLYFPK